MEKIFVLAILMGVFATAFSEQYDSRSKCGWRKKPKLLHMLPEGRPVYGVQPYGQEIYVIRDSTPYIEVYDIYNFLPKRNISVEGLRGPYDMVQSRNNKTASLFIIDWFNTNNMTVVQVPGGGMSLWPIQDSGFTTFGLAGPNSYTQPNFLVTASITPKIKKFSPPGKLVQEVIIQNISSPRQSIQVGPDRYAVCHGYGPPPELHQVCLVNGSGVTIKCHGKTQGSGRDLLNIPGRLEKNRKNCILVADTGNKRVVLLNENVAYLSDLISSGLNGPYRLYLDEPSKRLYVADNVVNATGIAISGRVLVYKIE